MHRGVLAGLLMAASLVVGVRPAWAWGPHPDITAAALRVLPERARWDEALGAGTLQGLTSFCWLPDVIDQDWGSFYADDYLLFRASPRPPGHYATYNPGAAQGYRVVRDAATVYLRRALQALRTETPLNAMRQLGPLVHYIEDGGAPPHAYAPESNPWHMPLENWLDARQVDIAGYQPQLLGSTDDEAIAGLDRRLAALAVVTRERCQAAMPLVKDWRSDLPATDLQKLEAEVRPQVAPILLESALDSSRAVADLLHTVLRLGLAPQADGAGLQGAVTAAACPGLAADKGARVLLLAAAGYTALAPGAPLTPCVTDYGTLATTAPGPAAAGDWHGRYAFTHLPAGTYRLLVYRTGAAWKVSDPVRLETGHTATLDVDLLSATPAGNLVENPQATLCYLAPRRHDWPVDAPDRWLCADPVKGVWRSLPARLQPGRTYRAGAVLKDPATRVRLQFRNSAGKVEARDLAPGAAAPEEIVYPYADTKAGDVTIQVETPRPLREGIDRVWVVQQPAP